MPSTLSRALLSCLGAHEICWGCTSLRHRHREGSGGGSLGLERSVASRDATQEKPARARRNPATRPAGHQLSCVSYVGTHEMVSGCTSPRHRRRGGGPSVGRKRSRIQSPRRSLAGGREAGRGATSGTAAYISRSALAGTAASSSATTARRAFMVPWACACRLLASCGRLRDNCSR